MAQETSGCTFLVMLAMLGFASLATVTATESVTVGLAVVLGWSLAFLVGLRRVFRRQRLGGTVAVASAFWLALSILFGLDAARDRREAAERLANLPAEMEDNYRRGVALLEQGNFAEALRNFERVEEIDPDYKDLWELAGMAREQIKTQRIELLVAQAERLPATEVERLSAIYGELAELRPEEVTYRARADTYRQRLEEQRELERKAQEQQRQAEEAQRQAEAQRKAEERERDAAERRQRRLEKESARQVDERERAAAQLHLAGFSWEVADGYAQAEGRVTNVTDWPLENVEARIRYRDAGGEVVLTDACLLDQRLLRPKTSSRFDCVKEAPPGIESADVSFATVHGSPLVHYHDRSWF
jgi:tetratricopeptide (TPR) repeat protein